MFLPFPDIPGTPFQIRGTEVHSLPVTLCMCASGAIFLILEENSYCVAPRRSPSLGCLAFCMFFFKALFRDRGTEGLGAPVQMGFVSLLCCLVSPSHTRGTAQFLAAPDAWVHLLAPPRPPVPGSLQASPSAGRCSQPMLKLLVPLLLSAGS